MYISRLLIGASDKQRLAQAEAYAKELTSSVHDIHHIVPNEKSGRVGISQIKALMRSLTLSPVQGDVKVGIIQNIDSATREAQNALLKLLEEPDSQTSIIATAQSKHLVLPTIRSRCLIITIEPKPSTSINKQYILPDNLAISDSEALTLSEQIASNKSLADQELSNWVRSLRAGMITIANKNPENTKDLEKHISSIRTIERARNTLTSTNVNSRLLLENLLFEISTNT